MTDALRIGRVELRPGFIVVAAVGCMFGSTGLFGCFALAAALHELGHVAVLFALGVSVERVTVSALGAEMLCSRQRLSYPRELAVYLAGPLASALVGVVCAFVARRVGSEPLYIFSGANILLGMFNLLPARSLDGGGALRVLSLMVFDREVPALDILHYTTAASLVALGLWASAHGGFNLALIWIAVWMMMGSRQP